MARRRLRIALLALGLAGGTAAAALGAVHRTAEPARPIALSGQVEGLVPAAPRDLVVHIANPNGAPLVVAAIATDVTAPGPGCPAAALHVGDLRAPVTVPAGGAADGVVPVTLTADAPDACQGARFALAFRATGRGEEPPAPAGDPMPPGTPSEPAPAPATPAAPVTPASHARRTTTVRRRVCRRRRVTVRVHGRRVRRWRRACRTVKVKVTRPA